MGMNTTGHFGKWMATVLLLASCLPALHAQDSNNVLGLPAVPQGAATNASPGKSATERSAPALPAAPTDADIKSILSGSMRLASSYQSGQITVQVITEKAFMGDKLRGQALQAARLVQRDVGVPCGKLCTRGSMPAPGFLANNSLVFDIVIEGYAGLLSTADMINLVSGKPVSPGAAAPAAKPPAPARAPVPAPPSASASASASAPAPALSPSPSPAPPAAALRASAAL